MDITRIRALRGPNLWTRHTALEAVVQVSDDERSTDRTPALEAALRKHLPALPALPGSMRASSRPVLHRCA